MLIVEELDRLFVDFHVLAVGDGRRLGRAHEMAPAPRKAGGVELLKGRLMVLEGVHLGEVVVHDDRGQTADERVRVVTEVSVLLRQVHSVLHLGYRAHLPEVSDLRPVSRWLRVDALLERIQQGGLSAMGQRRDGIRIRLWGRLHAVLCRAYRSEERRVGKGVRGVWDADGW